jgi:hypothetical protein
MWQTMLTSVVIASRVGTAMAFLAQITFTASVWQTYDQQIWRHLSKPLRMATLNDFFGAQASMMAYLNIDYLKTFPLGYFMGLFAWWVPDKKTNVVIPYLANSVPGR